MAGLTYTTYKQQMALLSVVPETDTNFLTALPSAIEYAELRMYRDLDLLSTVRTDDSTQLTQNSQTVAFPQGSFITVQNVNLIETANSASKSTADRSPILPVAKEYLQYSWPSPGHTGKPQYFAMLDDHTLMLGPWPDANYFIEIVGTFRPVSLSAANPVTYISQYLPDLFLMASMIYVSAYQRNFGRQNDDPQMAQSYEGQYKTLLAGAGTEEYRKKFAASSWTSLSSAPVATPTRG